MQKLYCYVDESGKDPEAEKIIVVLDNLNTHTPAAFYLAFEPDEAKRLVNRFEFHFMPKHGSWLNMAEIELSVLSQQCLNRRIPDEQTLTREVQAWVNERNTKVAKVDWRFSTADARIRLKRLYPKIHTLRTTRNVRLEARFVIVAYNEPKLERGTGVR